MNSLEERIVTELKAERDLVPKAIPGRVPQRQAQWPRYLAVAAILVVTVSLGLVVGRVISAEDRTAAAAIEAGKFLIDGDVVVPVVADLGRPASAPVRVLAGAPAPSLEVPLEWNGAEQVLVQDIPRWDPATIAGTDTVVYVGSVSGRSIFIHTNRVGLLDRVRAQLEGATYGDHICMTIGDSNTSLGGSGFCSGGAVSIGGRYHDNSVGESFGGWVTWIDVPDGTAVVTLMVDGQEVAWQTPVADTVFFDLGRPPTEPPLLVAIGVNGDELAHTPIPVDTTR